MLVIASKAIYSLEPEMRHDRNARNSEFIYVVSDEQRGLTVMKGSYRYSKHAVGCLETNLEACQCRRGSSGGAEDGHQEDEGGGEDADGHYSESGVEIKRE